MPLNNTEEEVKKSALKDHAKKLLLESGLLKTLKPIFNSILNDFRKTYAARGNFPNIAKHSNDIQQALFNHYDKVADNFSTQLEERLGEPDNRAKIRNDTEISARIHKAIQVPQSSAYIDQTNQRQMLEARNDVILTAAAAGLFLTNKQIANKAHALLAKKFANRLSLIAMDNTQNAAEQAKYAEYNAFIANGAIAGGIDFGLAAEEGRAKNLWSAIMDGKTRIAHAEADGQTVNVGEPFIVGGEKLRFPRDTSLGASMSNVANCRCSSVPVIS